MTGETLVEYVLNAVWQAPLVALAGYLVVRAARLGPAGEHRVWLGVLTACVLLPGLRLDGGAGEPRPGVESALQKVQKSGGKGHKRSFQEPKQTPCGGRRVQL